MKATEIKEMTVEEMNQKLVSLKEELFALRFQLAVNQLENTAKVKAVKLIGGSGQNDDSGILPKIQGSKLIIVTVQFLQSGILS